uniref:Uncharacterized protein n=1 Tax=Myripristis murdjan TaxID=586833 RepID=A0A667Y4X6_9TELE
GRDRIRWLRSHHTRSVSGRSHLINLQFVENQDGVITFDLCAVITCGPNEQAHGLSEKYICSDGTRNQGHHDGEYYLGRPYCGVGWDLVVVNTGPLDWGYQLDNPLKSRLALIKGTPRYPCNDESCNPLILTLKKPQLSDTNHYVLGAYETGTDPLGYFMITVTAQQPPEMSNTTKLVTDGIMAKDVANLSVTDVLEIETGFTEKNYWLDWVENAARMATREDCVVCSTPRPTLLTVPSPFSENETFCMMHLHTTENPTEACKHLETTYPLSPPKAIPPIFTPVRNNHTCLTKFDISGLNVGDIPEDWCTTTINVTDWPNATTLTYSRSDVYWYCGGNRLRNTLPSSWTGTCTILSLIAPITLIKITAAELVSHYDKFHYDFQPVAKSHLHKRAAFDLYHNSPIYIDAIGIPRGVPDEYKLVDQVAAGFESSLFWWVTINKNVDRINFIHFNVQRLSNMTRDAIFGLHEQLAATSLMTYQNRLALDFLLAEKGGVCAMFSHDCCIFIPNNTAPDGSVTRALSGLKTMADELVAHSGITNPLANWLDHSFGKWKTVIVSVLTSLLFAVTVLTLCGCCCIPCIRHLCLQCITRAINDRFPAPPPYQLIQYHGDTIPMVSLPEPGEDETEVDLDGLDYDTQEDRFLYP